MGKYLVVYIDEQEEYRDDFADKMSDEQFDVKAIHPFVSEEEMLTFLLTAKYDALIVDYGLMSHDKTIKYNGGDLLNKLGELREDFPAFILTMDIDQDGGVDETINSTMILEKEDLNSEGKLSNIKRKVKKLISKYKKDNENLSKEYYELVEKRKQNNNELGDIDLERLSYLDEKIEKRLLGKRKFPNLLKESSNLKDLNAILKDAEEFLKKNKET